MMSRWDGVDDDGSELYVPLIIGKVLVWLVRDFRWWWGFPLAFVLRRGAVDLAG